MCSESLQAAQELVALLESLKVKVLRHRKWKSARQALKTVWSKDKILALEDKLARYRGVLEMRILVSFRESLANLSVRHEEMFDRLSRSSNEVTSSFVQARDGFTTVLQAETQALLKLQQHSAHEITEIRKTNTYILDALKGSKRSSYMNIDATPAGRRVEWEVRTVSIENMLLNSLRFSTMGDRLEDVAEAHDSTFEWIFEDSAVDAATVFPRWLAGEGGIFWINGKAGAGKSTLMRFLFNHPKCKTLLQKWAAGTPLETAAFFFWNSGTLEQRSQSGLLRSLLFEVLRRRRELIPEVLSERWTSISGLPVETINAQIPESWSLTALKRCFQRLATQRRLSMKLCLFIDGLDEYSGDHCEMISLFQSITASPDIKVCLSSRPFLVFEDAFANVPNFKLQELTRSDISKYVYDKLVSNRKMLTLSRNQNHIDRLVGEIIQNAGGVFLWVTLVVQTLLNGMQNRDRISDLQLRLKELPPTLDGLYRHIMDGITPRFYQVQASEIFQLVRAGYERASSRTEENVEGGFSVLTLALADEDAADLAIGSTTVMTSQDMLSRCQDMEARIKTRCAGLLETKLSKRDGNPYTHRIPGQSVVASRFGRKLPHPKRKPADQAIQDASYYSFMSQTGVQKVLPATVTSNWKVQYLHRTVRDFLEQPDVWELVQSYTKNNPTFNPRIAMVRASVIKLKTLFPVEACHLALPNSAFAKPFWQLVADAEFYATTAVLGGRPPLVHDEIQDELFEELQKVVQIHLAYAKD